MQEPMRSRDRATVRGETGSAGRWLRSSRPEVVDELRRVDFPALRRPGASIRSGSSELPTAKSDSSTTKSESTPKVMTSALATTRSTGSGRGIRRRIGRAVGWPRTLGIGVRALAPIAKERRIGWPRRSISKSRTHRPYRARRSAPRAARRSARAGARGRCSSNVQHGGERKAREVISRLPGGRFLGEPAGWLLP